MVARLVMNMKTSVSERIIHAFIIAALIMFCLLVLYPLMNVLSSSFSSPSLIMKGEIYLLPQGLTLIGYKKIFANPDIWHSYINTIAYTVIGTAINLFMTAIGAYPLSRKDFHWCRLWMIMVTFTMFFSGGMIPTYLLIKQLHLYNTFWVMVIPGAVSTWQLIIMRTFFRSGVPGEIQEAAVIDGCNDLQIFGRIVIPLSTPIIAVLVLFYGVGHWNAYFNAMIYLQDKRLYPLQLILRDILVQNQLSSDMSDGLLTGEQQMIGESIKYALIIVATVPILMVYPFIQKYFTKGILIGAIKG